MTTNTPKPVRFTMSLDAQLYRQVKAIADDAAADIGIARVTNSQLITTLLHHLAENPQLKKAVLDDLKTTLTPHH